MKQNGQTLLIVLIASALIMTAGLSLSKKAVVETKIDTDEELLKQAFNTAESGIDYYLGTGEKNYSVDNNTKKAEVLVTALSVGKSLDFDEYYLENNPAIFWLVGHDTDGNIDYTKFYDSNNVNICVSDAFVLTGSLKVDLFYKDGSDFGVIRQGYNFTDKGNSEKGFYNKSGVTQGFCAPGKKEVNFNFGAVSPLLLSVSPIWSGTKISLTGSADFPSQGSEISSTGMAGDLNNGVNKKVTVQNRYRVPPFMFEAITAGESVN